MTYPQRQSHQYVSVFLLISDLYRRLWQHVFCPPLEGAETNLGTYHIRTRNTAVHSQGLVGIAVYDVWMTFEKATRGSMKIENKKGGARETEEGPDRINWRWKINRNVNVIYAFQVLWRVGRADFTLLLMAWKRVGKKMGWQSCLPGSIIQKVTYLQNSDRAIRTTSFVWA